MLLALFSNIVGFVVPPMPQAAAAALPPLAMLRLHTGAATSPVMLCPDEGMGLATTSMIADAGDRSDWAVSLFGSLDLDAIAVAAIPVALVAVLFVFFRMLKLFASAF